MLLCMKLLWLIPSQQVWKSGLNTTTGDEKDEGDKINWLDQWMSTKQWEINSRASIDIKEPARTGELHVSRPYFYSASRVVKSQYIKQLQRHLNIGTCDS